MFKLLLLLLQVSSLGHSRNGILGMVVEEELLAVLVQVVLLLLLLRKSPWEQPLVSSRSCRNGKIRNKSNELPIGKKNLRLFAWAC